MRPWSFAQEALALQRGTLFPWVPVCLAIGIGVYFSLKQEPGLLFYGQTVFLLLICLGLSRILGENLAPMFLAMSLVASGVILAGVRAHSIGQPVLKFRYYGPVEGRIVKLDRSASEAVRLTLDRVVLENTSPGRTPKKLRISLHGPQGYFTPEAGMIVILTGHLSAPQGPVEPGGFDFQRQAWFLGIGAVGYTRTPALMLEPAKPGFGLWITGVRMRLSARVRRALPGQVGGFAAAIMTGDRNGMSKDSLTDLRRSNLAHLLAISGLHMGMLTGFVFAVLRYGLALFPWLALRLPVKKIAAGFALMVALAYLALSGGNVATQRAFVMVVAVMLLAVMLNRRALTLRAVGLAALILLILRPESLLQPGFQMSFAATTALVAVFGGLRFSALQRLPRPVRALLAVVLSSAIAGAATTPVAAAHFNQIAHFGLLANVISVPIMGMLIMPSVVLAALLAPFGLSWLALALLARGISVILSVAEWIADLPNAVTLVASPGPMVLPLLALGALWIILWQGRVRFGGALVFCLGVFLWSQVERPSLLVSDSGGLVGVMTEQGRVLNKPTGEGFAAQNWLENDGDGLGQALAFERPGLSGPKGARVFTIGDQKFLHLTGRGARSRLPERCGPKDWVILAAEADLPSTCRILDRTKLAQTGAIALFRKDGELQLVSAKEQAGRRLWNRPWSKLGQDR